MSEHDRLAKLLGMLGSGHEGERANAAVLVVREMRTLGRTPAELVEKAFREDPIRAARKSDDGAGADALKAELKTRIERLRQREDGLDARERRMSVQGRWIENRLESLERVRAEKQGEKLDFAREKAAFQDRIRAAGLDESHRTAARSATAELARLNAQLDVARKEAIELASRSETVAAMERTRTDVQGEKLDLAREKAAFQDRLREAGLDAAQRSDAKIELAKLNAQIADAREEADDLAHRNEAVAAMVQMSKSRKIKASQDALGIGALAVILFILAAVGVVMKAEAGEPGAAAWAIFVSVVSGAVFWSREHIAEILSHRRA